MTKTKMHSAYYPDRLSVDFDDAGGPSLTRQEFAAECDINNIMKKYEATGIMPTLDGRIPTYWDASLMPENLQDAMNAMDYADELFMQLPAKIRREFNDDPVEFVDFATKTENRPKLQEWGLTEPEKVSPEPLLVRMVNADAASKDPPVEPQTAPGA